MQSGGLYMDENVFGGGSVTSATQGNSETERITRRLIFQNENFTADFSEFQQVMRRLLADQGRRWTKDASARLSNCRATTGRRIQNRPMA
jgi:hypothetical protein